MSVKYRVAPVRVSTNVISVRSQHPGQSSPPRASAFRPQSGREGLSPSAGLRGAAAFGVLDIGEQREHLRCRSPDPDGQVECEPGPRGSATPPLGTAGRRHDLDISSWAACWASCGLFRWKAMLNSTGATINTSHVTPIAATSNR